MKGVILLVEDNPDDEELTLLAMRENGLGGMVTVARDGEEALDYLWGRGQYSGRDTTDQPLLVLLDINLPKLSGIEVLAAMRADARTQCVPVVMLTTSAVDSDLTASYSKGANSYLVKPVDFGEFLELVSQLKRYWLGLNRVPSVCAAD